MGVSQTVGSGGIGGVGVQGLVSLPAEDWNLESFRPTDCVIEINGWLESGCCRLCLMLLVGTDGHLTLPREHLCFSHLQSLISSARCSTTTNAAAATSVFAERLCLHLL